MQVIRADALWSCIDILELQWQSREDCAPEGQPVKWKVMMGWLTSENFEQFYLKFKLNAILPKQSEYVQSNKKLVNANRI